MGDKRKKVVVTLEEKLQAIKRMDCGESVNKIALELGVGKTTVGDWRRNRAEIEKWCSKQASDSGVKVRKTMQQGKHVEVEEALYLWYENLRGKGLPVSGPLLQEKAIQFKKQIKGDDGEFTASDGWLDRWKKRFGVRQMTISGEALSANKDAVPDFKKHFFDLLDKEGISGEQVYNCDETGLNYRTLPSKTLASKQEKATPGFKKSKDRVTVLACSNATGNHKLRLTLIGKSRKPRAFKNLKDLSSLPLHYTHQKKAWMNGEIFKNWFEQEFVPQVEKHLADNNLPRKAILVLDNAPSHPANDQLKDGDIKALFLPANVTSVCQPMDQGVLQALKKKYRRRLLSYIIAAIDNTEVAAALQSVDMLDIIRWVSEAWDEIPSLTLVRSWKILLDHRASDKWEVVEQQCDVENVTDNTELVSLLEKVPGCEEASLEDITEWLAKDEIEETTDEDIVAMVLNEQPIEEEQGDEPSDRITHSEGLKAIETALEYIGQQEEATPADIICLRKWKDISARKLMRGKKQVSITNFFKP